MIEVEMKCKIADIDSVREKLLQQDFEKIFFLRETDTYYDDKEGSLRSSDSALRIRQVIDLDTQGQETKITYKGSKMDLKTMTRTEYETGIADASVMDQILRALGYHPVQPVVTKSRHEYQKGHMHVCLDTVDGLGDFIELEIMVASEALKEEAVREMEQMLQQLGYTMEDTTRVSYLSQLMHVGDE